LFQKWNHHERVEMSSKTRVSALSWTYTAGYLAYLIVAGIKTWPTMTWSAWWSDLALQAAWDAAFWPYYFPRLLAKAKRISRCAIRDKSPAL